MLQTFLTRQWNESCPGSLQKHALNSLENGQILFFPHLNFPLLDEENIFLTPDFADPHAKHISYHAEYFKLWGVQHLNDHQHIQLKNLMGRYAEFSRNLIAAILPNYASSIKLARTSFRPVEICSRKTSYRKDDKRLHVDAFPSAPNQGSRILRVFTNVNPYQQDRLWRVGEPFEKVATRFISQLKKPVPGSAALLRFLKITKSYRTMYDHYMLHLHDLMKKDSQYQQQVAQQEIAFPSGSTWIAHTDDVSHAVMQGQYVLEQTFYLPISAMQDASKSPLRILERLLARPLI